jgi:hypothetical protein
MRSTPLQEMICAVAPIEFAFETYELLMLPLIVPSALTDLFAARPEYGDRVQSRIDHLTEIEHRDLARHFAA